MAKNAGVSEIVRNLAEPIADILAVTFTAILFSVQFRHAKRIMQDDTTAVAETDVHSK
jgi:hypothetical protein